MEEAESITARRLALWNTYHAVFAGAEAQDKLRRPIIPEGCQHNAHLYYLLLPDQHIRDAMLDYLKRHGIGAVFHYVPLHSSPAGIKYGRTVGDLNLTTTISQRLLRLPLWVGLEGLQGEVIAAVLDSI